MEFLDRLYDGVTGFFDGLGAILDSGFRGAMVVLPLVIGAVLVVVGIRQLFIELGGHKVRATATCIGVDWERSRTHGDARHPPIACPRLRVNLDGVERELFNGVHSSAYRGIKEGMAAPIRVNPDDPDDYYIDQALTAGRLCLLVGIVMIAIGIVAHRCFFG